MCRWPSRLGRRLGLPVALCHDVRAAARAEASFGPAAGAGDFLLVQAGTGIAAALVLDGLPYPGAHALSGEIGHVAVAAGAGRRCGCGGTGCLETVASAAAVARRYRELSGRQVTRAASVVRLVTAGDPAAQQAIATIAACPKQRSGRSTPPAPWTTPGAAGTTSATRRSCSTWTPPRLGAARPARCGPPPSTPNARPRAAPTSRTRRPSRSSKPGALT